MDKIRLVVPDETMENSAIEFKQEFFDNSETVISGDFKWGVMSSYLDWLKMVRGSLYDESCNPKWGVISTFFAMKESDNKIIGIINLRHTLTPKFINFGHIGYSVRPTERRKGYASEMLKQLLIYAKDQGLHEVEVVCEDSNVGSIKTIMTNRGELLKTVEGKNFYSIII